MPAYPVPCNRPFTLAEGIEAGLTERVLRGRGYQRLFHGIYASAQLVPTTRVLAQAALLLAPPGSLIARHTAATLWGGVAPATADVLVVLPHGSRLRVSGIKAPVRRCSEERTHVGLPITSPVQTFLDLSEGLELVDLVVLGDSLVRAKVVTREQLVTGARCFGGRHARLARRAAAHVRVGVDSAMETRVRMLLVLAGLPEPMVNHTLRDEGGRVIYRLDLSYPQWRIAIEYDGRQHAENTAQWRWDVQRREDLDAFGWRLVVILSSDVYATPGRTLDRVVAAVRAQGGHMAVRTEQWRRYFPDRSAA